MYIIGKHYNNLAVSAIIAALLLIAITVAAAILVYVFSIGLLGSLQSGGGQQTKQQLIMEAYSWLVPAGPLAMTMRNVGPATIQFADVFINGVVNSGGASGCYAGLKQLAVGSSCVLTIAVPTSNTSGVAYPIKVVTIDGAVFSYSAIAGSAS
jgi:FlaG/FlaF family flagellin (archaellin)